jgi:hypothetical protein
MREEAHASLLAGRMRRLSASPLFRIESVSDAALLIVHWPMRTAVGVNI